MTAGPRVTSLRAAAPVASRPNWLGQWPPAFRRVLVYALVSSAGWLAFDGFLTPYLRATGVPVVTIGLFHGLSAAIGAPGAAAGGFVADRWGRRTGLLLGGALRILGWALILARPGTTYLVAVAALTGMGWAASSAYLALVAEVAPQGRRASAYAASMIVENLMAMAVPLVTGFLADTYGLRVALSVALFPAALALLVIRWLPETAGPGARRAAATAAGVTASEASPGMGAGLSFLLSPAGRGALTMGLIWMMTGFQFGMMGPVRPLYVVDRFGVSYAGLGVVTMLGSLGMLVGTAIGGRVADRVGQSRLMMACLGTSAALYAIIPLAGAAPLYAGLLVVANTVAYTAAPCWGAVGANAAPRRIRGSVSGLFIALRAVGGTAGGLLSGVVYSYAITMPFYVTVGSELTMLLLVLLGASRAWPGFGRGMVHQD